MMSPSLFLSHGAPTLILEESPARRFLSTLAGRLERPKAVLVASAHWETLRPKLSAVTVNETIHDFRGFPKALYEMRYPAPGSVELAERVSDLLAAQGIAVGLDHARGLDHGAWVPLKLMFPDADVPVVQLSVQGQLGPAHHFQVGRALASLRQEGVLVIGSGSFTHNLGELAWSRPDTAAPEWVSSFTAWMHQALAEGRTCDLLTYRQRAPHAAENHPTEEHLLPLFVAWGAAGEHPKAERLHASTQFGALSMDAYAFS